MRKLRLIEGFTLLKVTQLVNSRVRIHIQARMNPDARSSPPLLPHHQVLPEGGWGQLAGCQNHHTHTHTHTHAGAHVLKANCVV